MAGVGLRPRRTVSLTATELDQLRAAELALAGARDTEEAAAELAGHAVALLGAGAAVVLIEGIGDTVRVTAGPTAAHGVYGSGSRMRLLDDAGVPCGSIAVSARADGRPYGPRDERILDALAERVSTTLHQLSLLAAVDVERRTLADLVGSSSDGIFSVGSDLRVRAWNPAMATITGVGAEQAIGEHINRSFHPTFADGTPATGSADPGLSGEHRGSVLLQVTTGDEVRWLTCSYSPLSDGGYAVIARDDTARKKLQDDKDGWIAQVSHELRTPLTPIKGFLHTLARRDEELTGADRAKIYEILLREEARLEALVDSLLRSTQLDAGGFVARPEAVDWTRVVADQVDLVARQDPSRTVTIDVPAGLPAAWVDPTLATSVLTNLLTNAAKYATPATPIEVVVRTDGGEVRTEVIDHGPGVPRSDRARVFEKFTRLGDHLTRTQQGVGLGLHIAKRSTEELGGRIGVDETPGGGATFWFTIPTGDPTTTSSAAAAAAAVEWRADVDRDDDASEVVPRRRAQLRAPGSPPARR